MNKRTLIALVGVFTAGFLSSSALARGAEPPDSEHVSKLLSEAKTMAFQLKEDAQTMEGFTRMDVSWESHKVAINQIRDNINALGRQVTKLKEARAEASPWQKTAIDRISPYLDELAGYTAAVIEHVSGEQRHSPADYKDYLEANADYASDLAAMISDFVDYGKTKQRMERLSEKLEVPRTK